MPFLPSHIDPKCEQRQREFLKRGLASRNEAARNATYVSSDTVLRRLEQITAQAKASQRR